MLESALIHSLSVFFRNEDSSIRVQTFETKNHL